MDEKARARVQRYRDRHLDEIRERERRWYWEHRDQVRAAQRAHPEWSRKWKERNEEKRRAYNREWYRKNRDRVLEAARKREQTPEMREKRRLIGIRRRRELRAFIDSLKKGRSCPCGFSDYRALVFHHRSKTGKDLHLGEAVCHGWSKDRILREVRKCVILCANCHTIRHHRDAVRSRAKR